MLEMVHYILTFTITMKHVIYRAILSAGRASGECCKLPQRRGVWAGAPAEIEFDAFSLKIWHLVAPIFHFPWLFQKVFSPDLSLTTQIP